MAGRIDKERSCNIDMYIRRITPIIAFVCLLPGYTGAQPAADAGALAKMPVKEITVFKDGHALVVHQGKMPTDAEGNVQMDYLPTPVLGTFWPYVQPNGPKLSAVIASPRRVKVARTALSIREMLQSNVGDSVQITEVGGKQYAATVVGIPERSGQELERTSPPDQGEKLPEISDTILLKTTTGTEALPLARIQDVTFAGVYRSSVSSEEFRNLLTMKLDWGGRAPAKTADVGMMYLQKGIRWIPSYKVSIDGKGGAEISLQATLINEMTDLQDVTANLVVGVPTFYFQDLIDPIALQQTVAQLSPLFSKDSSTPYSISNGIMSQSGGFGGGGGFRGAAGAPGAPAPDLGPELSESGKSEDLFVYTVRHVTLKKGQRMTLPIVEVPVKYRDVYTVDIQFTPPREIRTNNQISDQQQESIREMLAPKAIHVIRLVNDTKFPFTTAPALILSSGKLIAQTRMTYTPIGGDIDLKLTTAVNIKVKKTDKETLRTPNAATINNNHISRIDLQGDVSITNYGTTPAELEATRNVLGNVSKADHNGVAQMVNVFEDDSLAPVDTQSPYWWGWYSWPYWWNHFNGVGRIIWKLTLQPSQAADLGYNWNYYWE